MPMKYYRGHITHTKKGFLCDQTTKQKNIIKEEI